MILLIGCFIFCLIRQQQHQPVKWLDMFWLFFTRIYIHKFSILCLLTLYFVSWIRRRKWKREAPIDRGWWESCLRAWHLSTGFTCSTATSQPWTYWTNSNGTYSTASYYSYSASLCTRHTSSCHRSFTRSPRRFTPHSTTPSSERCLMNSAQFVHVSQFIRHLWFMISLYVFKTRTTKKTKIATTTV